jgi:hypothetical protein
VVARLGGKIAGYVFSGELSAQANVPVVQSMLRAYGANAIESWAGNVAGAHALQSSRRHESNVKISRPPRHSMNYWSGLTLRRSIFLGPKRCVSD